MAAQPAWMRAARAETGVATFAPGSSNPRVTQYHDLTNLRGYDDKASWCSSFANWCLVQVGIAGTGSALARSWLDWGRVIDQPVPGCIVVLYRGDPAGWTGHVGFYLRSDARHIHLFGGNQLDRVCENSYPLKVSSGFAGQRTTPGRLRRKTDRAALPLMRPTMCEH